MSDQRERKQSIPGEMPLVIDVTHRRYCSFTPLVSDDCVQELRWWLNTTGELNFREIKPGSVDVHCVPPGIGDENWRTTSQR